MTKMGFINVLIANHPAGAPDGDNFTELEEKAPDEKKPLYHSLSIVGRDPVAIRLLGPDQLSLIAFADIADIKIFFRNDERTAQVVKDTCQMEMNRLILLAAPRSQPQPHPWCVLI